MLQETRTHKSKSATPFSPVSVSLCTTRCDPTQLLGLRTESELVVVFVGLARQRCVYNRLVFVIVGRYVFHEVEMNFDMFDVILTVHRR